MFKQGWLLPFLLLALNCAGAAAAQFSAALDRDTITLGETVTLSLGFTGVSPASVPKPAIRDVQVLSSGVSSRYQIENGRASSVVTHTFMLSPQAVGEYIVPAFTVNVAGETLTSNPIPLKVSKPGAPPPAAITTGANWAFLRLFLPKNEVYEGETIVAELQLLVRPEVYDLDQFQVTAFPADGFTVGKLVEGTRRRAQIGAIAYTIIPLQVPLSCVKAGSLKVGPVTGTVVVRVPQGRQSDSFFGMFGSGRQQVVVLATEEAPIKALPLPKDNVPAGFSGAVGEYRLDVAVAPTNVAVGDPITVRVQIAGRGNLEALSFPDQPGWGDFKKYPSTSRLEITDNLGLAGSKTFEQVIAPERADITALPAVAFSFFDPSQGKYRTLEHSPVPLVVRPAERSGAPLIGSRQEPEEPPPTGQDIVHIKPRLGAIAQVSVPLVRQPWFLWLQTVPVLLYVLSIWWRRRSEELAGNPRLKRKRLADETIRKGLVELRQFARENRSDDFFASVFRLLQERIGEKMDTPASSITEAVIDEQLVPRGVPENVVEPLRELFQSCNLARYAPVRTSEELSAYIPKVEQVLSGLERLKL